MSGNVFEGEDYYNLRARGGLRGPISGRAGEDEKQCECRQQNRKSLLNHSEILKLFNEFRLGKIRCAHDSSGWMRAHPAEGAACL
jgi:hypothetical protein